MALTTGDNNYSPARYQVSAVPGYGNYTDIQSALNAANASGVPSDVLVMPGSYTQDLNMYASVNLTGWGCDGSNVSTQDNLNNVVINGVIYATYDGSATISGITCVSNGNGCINMDSSSTSSLTVKNCQFIANDTAFVFMQNVTGFLDIYDTNVYLTNATTNFNMVGGFVNNYNCNFISDHAAMSTNSTDGLIGGHLTYNYCFSSCNVISEVVSGSVFTANYSTWKVTGTAGPVIQFESGGTYNINFCQIFAGSNVAINIPNETLLLLYSEIISSNTNAITGTNGTLNYGAVIFSGSQSITVTTQNPIPWPTREGGTGLTSYVTGQTIYASATNVLSRLNIGTAGEVLTVVGGVPAWSNSASVGLPWIDEGSGFVAVSNNGYFIDGSLTSTLPASPSQGNIVAFQVVKSGSPISFTIQANSGQFINIGNGTSSATGSATNTQNGDAVYLVYRATDTTWYSTNGTMGTWLLN